MGGRDPGPIVLAVVAIVLAVVVVVVVVAVIPPTWRGSPRNTGVMLLLLASVAKSSCESDAIVSLFSSFFPRKSDL